MNVLFVSSGNNSLNKPSSIVLNQAISLENENVKVDHYLIKGKGIKGYIKNILPIIKLINNKNFDILHAHYGTSGIIAKIAIVLSMKKTPIIVSYMGDDLLGSNNFSGKKNISSLFFTKLNRFFANNFNNWNIVKSIEMQSKISNLNITSVIPNGVDFTKFYPIEKSKARIYLNLPINKKIILFPSNPNRPEKNFKLVHEAIQKLNDNTILLLTIYNASQEDLLYYYNASDLITLSSFHEGSPNVIKEAMACCRPIVSTKVGDVIQWLNKTEGCYITDFNSDNFCSAIEKALLYNNQTNGRDAIIDIECTKIAKKIKNIYKEIIGKCVV